VTAAVADAFVDALDAHGMDTVVGIGGTRTLRLLGALERRATTRFIAARTRPHCPRMRQGDRTPGSPTDIDRPGCLNVTAALQDASWFCLPLLHITTSVIGDGLSGRSMRSPLSGSLRPQPVRELSSWRTTTASARSRLQDPDRGSNVGK
jgi:hypothetical protein